MPNVQSTSHDTPPVIEGEHERLLEATLDHFSGRRLGAMNAFAFNEPDPGIIDDPVRGGEHWTNMIMRNLLYYLIIKEAEVIKDKSQEIGEYLPAGLMSADLGPGERQAQLSKTLPHQQSLRNNKAFAGVDVNSVFAKSTAELIEEKTGVSSQAIVGDFLSEQLNIFPNDRAVFSLFGGLLCNFGREPSRSAKDVLTETFNNLSLNMKPGDYLVITQDTNQIEESLLNTYDDPDMGLYILSILHKIKRDLPTENFDPYAFEFVPRWDKDEQLLSLNIKLKDDYPVQNFTINDEPFSVRHKQEIPLVNSYKFTAEFFIEAAEAAGYKSEKLFRCDDNPIVEHVFQYKPDVHAANVGRSLKVA
jgi:uncharacterized SAM-dependent methyltransferase